MGEWGGPCLSYSFAILGKQFGAQGYWAAKVKMADLSGTDLSEEKDAEIELKKRQKRPWDDLHKSGKIGISPELPETLGFYDISSVRREQREHPAGNRWIPFLTLLTLQLI